MDELVEDFNLIPKLLKPTALQRNADIITVLVAISLPWSTTLSSILVIITVVAIVPLIDIEHFMITLKRPACYMPVALALLALIGTLWSDVAWSTRFHAFSASAKFLVLPLLIYQFERSKNGLWVLVGFVSSCSLLLIVSWIVSAEPSLAIKSGSAYGVPVKNYIDQSQEFSLCAIILLWTGLYFFKQKSFFLAAAAVVVSIAFFADLAFVNVSRTALICTPLMLSFLIFSEFNIKKALIAHGALTGLIFLLFIASPLVRAKTVAIFTDYISYSEPGASTSGGQRLEFWRKSLQFVADAPLIGHGTGSIRSLFESSALNQKGVSAEVVANPHNQLLYSATQWGIAGVALTVAMWAIHFLNFRVSGFGAWVGLLIILQNFTASLFNSHLSDFLPGWMYVLGVGVACGSILKFSRIRDR